MIHVTEIPWDNDEFRASIPLCVYSPHNSKYQCCYMENTAYEDLSFAVFDDTHFCAAVLITHGIKSAGNGVLDWYGLPATCIQAKRHLSKECVTVIKSHLQDIVTKYGQSSFLFSEFLTTSGITCCCDFFLERCTKYTLSFYATVDLSLGDAAIWGKIRKSYKSLINKSLKLLDHKVITSATLSPEDFTRFKTLHFQCSKRNTRNDQSWTCQEEMVKNGHAFLVMSYMGNELVGASLYLMDRQSCFYGVGAYDRSLFNDIPIAHGAMWQAILHAKKCCVNTFVIGKCFYPLSNEQIPAKELSIGTFKKGFATNIIPRLFIYAAGE